METGMEKFLKGTLSISFAVILTKIMGVIYKIPLSYILGDSGMGYFNSAYAVYSFFYVLSTSGIPKAITLSISECYARGGSSSQCVVKNGLRLFMWVGIVISIVSALSAPLIVKLIGAPNSLYTILVITPSIIFVSVSGVLRGALNSFNKLTVIAISQLIESFVKLVLGLALAFIGYRMRLQLHVISAMCVAGITIGSVISFIYLYIVVIRHFKTDISEQKRKNENAKIKFDLIKKSVPISLGAAALNLSSIMDLGIIMRRLNEIGFSENESGAIYGNYTTLAVPMFNLVISLISPIMLAFLPQLADSCRRGAKKDFSDTVARMLTVNKIIAIPAFFAFYFYSFELLDLLFLQSSAAIGAELLRTLSLAIPLLSLLTLVNTALEARGKISVTVISLLIGSIIKAVGNCFLIGKMGICGAPLSTVVSYAAVLAISLVALNVSGVKCKIPTDCFPELTVGYLCFLFPYAAIYATGRLSGIFAAIVCLVISVSVYFFFLCMRVKRKNNMGK